MAQDQEQVPLILDNHQKGMTDAGRADFGGHQPAEGRAMFDGRQQAEGRALFDGRQDAEGRAEFGGVHGVLAASGNIEPFMGAVAASGGVAAQDALISQMFNLDSSNCFQK